MEMTEEKTGDYQPLFNTTRLLTFMKIGNAASCIYTTLILILNIYSWSGSGLEPWNGCSQQMETKAEKMQMRRI